MFNLLPSVVERSLTCKCWEISADPPPPPPLSFSLSLSLSADWNISAPGLGHQITLGHQNKSSKEAWPLLVRNTNNKPHPTRLQFAIHQAEAGQYQQDNQMCTEEAHQILFWINWYAPQRTYLQKVVQCSYQCSECIHAKYVLNADIF